MPNFSQLARDFHQICCNRVSKRQAALYQLAKFTVAARRLQRDQVVTLVCREIERYLLRCVPRVTCSDRLNQLLDVRIVHVVHRGGTRQLCTGPIAQ